MTGCADPGEREGFAPTATRGYILISLDTLRTDRLGAYGGDFGTSPFLDRLSSEATVFESATAPYPSTLVSHMSMFTGLYPPQHGVYPPYSALRPSVPTLGEKFAAGGFRTQGHTEGGFVAAGYGFERGFEVYDDTVLFDDSDIERTFERGLSFLDSLQSDERFFLFLHTYSAHDPYDPPARFVEQFGDSEPGPLSKGERLRDFNLGQEAITPAEVERFGLRYSASVRYVDSVLESFVTDLGSRGLLEETTLVITSDHGEEFLEHGRLGHTQLFPETLGVPLIIVHPGQSVGQRISDEVSLVDVAPTLISLAGLPPLEQAAGRSLEPYLRNPHLERPIRVYAEVDDLGLLGRSLTGGVDGTRYLLRVAQWQPDADGSWVLEEGAEMDYFESRLEFRSRSYDSTRRVTVLADGVEVAVLEIGTDWQDLALDLPGEGLKRLTLQPDGCSRPIDRGEGRDSRCLSFIIKGPPVSTIELFDLDADPRATMDVSRSRPLVARRLIRDLLARQFEQVSAPEFRELTEEDTERLRDLGYLD